MAKKVSMSSMEQKITKIKLGGWFVVMESILKLSGV